ncbi:MAG: carboxylesterase family protein [Lachnospiraceae bacterium]|nr:carboxylesterase family protein [Lachnospiraceae bacterium]
MIQTKYGKVSGIDHGWYEEYRGIPYAKAPVGELRWKAPQEPEPFEGVYDATAFQAKCWQRTGSSPPWDKDFYDDPNFEKPLSEDCLYLNIWAPKEASGCPVAFWIHGGAFMGGSGAEKEFDGAEYARRGVIFVSIQYRLGIFGFLAHPWLTEESGFSGNYGILDQIAALKWVYENIEAFGGDPDNITVFGQSAGAMSTQTLISTPLTGHMIAKAILQSGGSYGVGLHRDMPLKEEESYGKIFEEVLGVSFLKEMREIPADKLFELSGAFMGKAMPLAKGLFLTPNMDGRLLSGGYYELMDKGEIKDIPYMVGSTKDDIMVSPDMKDPMERPLYKGSIAFSEKLEALGRKPAFVYSFERDLPGDAQGAWHSAELWYMMGTLGRCWRPWEEHDYVLSARMLDCWTNFMKTGDPNGAGEAAWRPCTKADPFVMVLD